MSESVESELDESKRLALEIRTRIESSTEDERKELLDELYEKWVEREPENKNIFTFLDKALENFGLKVDTLRAGTFERARKIIIFEVTYLHLFFMQERTSIEDEEEDEEDEEEELQEIKMKFNKIFSSIIDAENAIRSSIFLQTSMSEEEFKLTDSDVGLFRFTPIDYSSNTAYQNLLIYLLEQLMRKGYRRYNGECYKPIFTEEGYDTHAWEKAMTLKEFIHEVCKKEINFNMWKNLTSSKDNARAAVTYLSEYIGGEFEDLHKDRHVFSFNNGVYIIKKWKGTEEDGLYVDEWIPFEGPGSKTIGSSVVACRYFDTNFEDCTELANSKGWFGIVKDKCPFFKSIMDHQEWEEEVQKWMCILIGRNLYKLGELDEWQIIAYLLGLAGTGKCERKDTPIIMYDGSIKMVQDVQVGDLLMGDDSTPRKVEMLSRGKGQLYRVKQVNGDDYYVNENHVLSLKVSYVSSKKCEYRIINNKKYKKGDIVDIPIMDYMNLTKSQKRALKGFKVSIDFPEKELALDPYLVGLWLGDGDTNASIITNRDAPVLKYLANKLPQYNCYLQYSNFNYKYRINGNYKDNYFTQELKHHNLLGNKHIPDIYKYNSRKNRLELLAGILDTDGHYDTSGNFDIIQKSKKLAEDIQYLVRSLGFYTKISECTKRCMVKGEMIYGTYYRMCISGNLDEIPTKIVRKQAFARKQRKNVLHTSITIEKAEIDEYYGFQLDGNHRYLHSDMTVTHNSTILTKIVKKIYEACDVGVLSNNIERKFGLSSLYEKFMYVGPEIKGNLALEQSEFQSMISGEDIQVAEKHKVAKSIIWQVPGMLAGNEVPNYTDNSGSISRRLLVFKFDNRVSKGDTRLGRKLEKEMKYIVQASVKGYLEAVDKYDCRDIWDIVPKYFLKNREAMAESTNALVHYLKSERCKLGADQYVRSCLFVTAFNDYCREHNLGSPKWSEEYFLGPFSMFNISLRRDCRRRYPNVPGARSFHGLFIMGVDINWEREGKKDDQFDVEDD